MSERWISCFTELPKKTLRFDFGNVLLVDEKYFAINSQATQQVSATTKHRSRTSCNAVEQSEISRLCRNKTLVYQVAPWRYALVMPNGAIPPNTLVPATGILRYHP